MLNQNKFVAGCDKFMAFCFYALIYFLPISIALSEAFVNLALVTFFIKRGAIICLGLKNGEISFRGVPFYKKIFILLNGFKPLSSYLSIPILVFLLFNIFSIVFSRYPSLSISGFFGKTLQGAFIYFNFIEAINTKKRLKIFLIAYFASCLLVSINGLFQYFVGYGFIDGHVFDGQINSSLRQANDFGSYLVVVIPVLFCLSALVVNGQKREILNETSGFSFLSTFYARSLIVILFLLSLACLGLTYSRGAWLSFAFSLFLLGMRNRKRFLLSILFVLLFVFIFAPGMFRTRESIGSFYYFFTNNNRFLYWKGAIAIIKDYPLFGAGLNTYSIVRSQYNIDWGGYPHNCFLQMFAETGFFGISAFIWMMFVLFRNAGMALKKINIASFKILLLSFSAGLAGFLFHSFWDTTLYSVQLGSLMWVVMGIIVAIQKILDENISTNNNELVK